MNDTAKYMLIGAALGACLTGLTVGVIAGVQIDRYQQLTEQHMDLAQRVMDSQTMARYVPCPVNFQDVGIAIIDTHTGKVHIQSRDDSSWATTTIDGATKLTYKAPATKRKPEGE